MPRPARATLALTLCLTTLFTSVSGLAGGAVLCVDGDGCVAVELAHAQHRHCHAESRAAADAESHEDSHAADACCEHDEDDADRAFARSAQVGAIDDDDHRELCTDLAIGAQDVLKARRTDGDSLSRPAAAAPAFAAALPASPGLSVPLPGDSPPAHGARPRAELISLRATVLLV